MSRHLSGFTAKQVATRGLAALLALGFCLSAGLADAAPKKKDTGPDPAAKANEEVKKSLEPIEEQLTKLMIKIQSRALMSPKDAGQLADLKYKLVDLMNQYPQNTLLPKPVYQAGVLFMLREEYNDAYELFNFLALGFGENAYGAKAKGQIMQLEKRFGANYFSVEMAAPGNGQPAEQPTASPSTAPPKK